MQVRSLGWEDPHTHTHTALPVGHELQNLYEELPQAFPPHLALQLHLVAGGRKQGEPAGAVRPGPGPDTRVASASSLVHTPAPRPLPVQDFITALHVKPEVREGDGHRSVFPRDEVPGSVVRHLLALLSVLPAPLALLVPGRQRQSGQGSAEHSQPLPPRRAYMVRMLVLVRSKAQSTVAGSRPDTRLHSMETFNLQEERRLLELAPGPAPPAAWTA